MKINYEDKNFIQEVEAFTKSQLNGKADLKILIDISVSSHKEKEFEELTFTAKYICGMLRVLKNAPGIPEVQSIDHVKGDLNQNIKKAIEQLRNIIVYGDKGIQDYFEKTYLLLSAQNIINLNQLLSDLESVKKYINYLKRKS